jgi:hypothetical protein
MLTDSEFFWAKIQTAIFRNAGKYPRLTKFLLYLEY